MATDADEDEDEDEGDEEPHSDDVEKSIKKAKRDVDDDVLVDKCWLLLNAAVFDALIDLRYCRLAAMTWLLMSDSFVDFDVVVVVVVAYNHAGMS